jgi:hypothetical protein
VGQYQTPKEMGGIFQKRKWRGPYDRIILILAVQLRAEIKTVKWGVGHWALGIGHSTLWRQVG